ncbi:MAG: TetR/AcrR family transcriptional regulator [Zymomonas mobilis subsp. pomaceae]
MDTCKHHKYQDRREAILEEATKFFLEKGYAETSMSAIAAKVGGSKGTLWSHFPSKEALFAAVVERLTDNFHKIYVNLLNPQSDIEVTLNQYGQLLLKNIVKPDKVAVHKLAVSECWRFPEVGRIFYESGPKIAIHNLGLYLKSAMDKGQICQDDPEKTAGFFLHSLCAASIPSRLYNIPQPELLNNLEKDVSKIVSLFLKAYAPKKEK